MNVLLTIGYVLIGLFGVAGFVWLHRWFWARFFRLEERCDEIHRVVCSDGRVIELFRTRGTRQDLATQPVITCHGICANRFHLNFQPGRSLVGYLSAQGMDVWNLQLRGFDPRARKRLLGERGEAVLFEDFVDLDLPAAVQHVLNRTGAEQVHWVGHSMGGMIAYAAAQGPHAHLLASVTAIGSPGRIVTATSTKMLASLSWSVGWIRTIPLRFLSQVAAPFYRGPFVGVPPVELENCDTSDVRRVMSNVICDIPGSLVRQLAGWTFTGEITAEEDSRNFTQGMERVLVPILGIAGDADAIAPPSSVRFAVEKAGSETKAFLNLGGADGASGVPRYGHGDLLFGRHVERDVFPRVAGWLASVGEFELGLEPEAIPTMAEEVVLQEPPKTGVHRPVQAVAPAPPPIALDAAWDDLIAPPLKGYDQPVERIPDSVKKWLKSAPVGAHSAGDGSAIESEGDEARPEVIDESIEDEAAESKASESPGAKHTLDSSMDDAEIVGAEIHTELAPETDAEPEDGVEENVTSNPVEPVVLEYSYEPEDSEDATQLAAKAVPEEHSMEEEEGPEMALESTFRTDAIERALVSSIRRSSPHVTSLSESDKPKRGGKSKTLPTLPGHLATAELTPKLARSVRRRKLREPGERPARKEPPPGWEGPARPRRLLKSQVGGDPLGSALSRAARRIRNLEGKADDHDE